MMNHLLILTACLALLNMAEAKPSAARYDDFKVYRVEIKTQQDFSEFRNLGNSLPLRYLTELKGPGFSHDIVIDPAHQDQLEKQLKFLELDAECIIDNLQSVIETAQTRILDNETEEMDWDNYHDLRVIYNWLKKIAFQYRSIAQLLTIGHSYENRPIKAMHISAKRGNKAIYIQSNIHAVEWISSAAVTCFLNSLLSSREKRLKKLLMEYDWIILPVLNTDGFEYSHHEERLWRKNRKPTGFRNETGICYGTDLNRNYNYKWAEAGYNIDVPCDHWYGGSEPNSEPEIVAEQEFVNSFPEDYIRMFLAFHTFGNMVLLPYGHTNTTFPPEYDDMMDIGDAFGLGASVPYGTIFRTGASAVLNYPVSGSAKDWAYGVKKIPFSATVELRDNGKYGFFLPPEQIKEVCTEVINGMVAMVDKAKEKGIFD